MSGLLRDERDFDGMRVGELVSRLGLTDSATRAWIWHNGYRINDGKVRRMVDFRAVERKEQERLAATPASFPCPRCGAARACEHRHANGERRAA